MCTYMAHKESSPPSPPPFQFWSIHGPFLRQASIVQVNNEKIRSLLVLLFPIVSPAHGTLTFI